MEKLRLADMGDHWWAGMGRYSIVLFQASLGVSELGSAFTIWHVEY